MLGSRKEKNVNIVVVAVVNDWFTYSVSLKQHGEWEKVHRRVGMAVTPALLAYHHTGKNRSSFLFKGWKY